MKILLHIAICKASFVSMINGNVALASEMFGDITSLSDFILPLFGVCFVWQLEKGSG